MKEGHVSGTFQQEEGCDPGNFGRTGEEYQKLLGAPKEQGYVILVAVIVDTALITATSEREAAEKYELPYHLEGEDVAIWCMTHDEFDEMMKEGGREDTIECAGCNQQASPPEPTEG